MSESTSQLVHELHASERTPTERRHGGLEVSLEGVQDRGEVGGLLTLDERRDDDRALLSDWHRRRDRAERESGESDDLREGEHVERLGRTRKDERSVRTGGEARKGEEWTTNRAGFYTLRCRYARNMRGGLVRL